MLGRFGMVGWFSWLVLLMSSVVFSVVLLCSVMCYSVLVLL